MICKLSEFYLLKIKILTQIRKNRKKKIFFHYLYCSDVFQKSKMGNKLSLGPVCKLLNWKQTKFNSFKIDLWQNGIEKLVFYETKMSTWCFSILRRWEKLIFKLNFLFTEWTDCTVNCPASGLHFRGRDPQSGNRTRNYHYYHHNHRRKIQSFGARIHARNIHVGLRRWRR